MHRAVKHSAELVFVDASGNMDRYNARVFLLLTHSSAGGLPLGVLILPNEQTTTIIAALQLYSTLLDAECFGGRGQQGPVVFMTDDSTAERNALHTVFPDAQLLLCAFHVLQAFWRFLWDHKSGIAKEHRQYLFSFLKGMVYAQTEAKLESEFSKAMEDSCVQRHVNVHSHLQQLFSRRQEWAQCCRSDLPVRGNNTNNFCESAMRVVKDEILQRTKAFNLQQLVDFMTTRFDSHYQRRLLDVANGRFTASRFYSKSTCIDLQSIKQVESDLFEVSSEKSADTKYVVDMSVGRCTCPKGNTGGPCKHQAAVVQNFNRHSWNFLPVNDPDMRKLFYFVATGDKTAPSDWFKAAESCDHSAIRRLVSSCAVCSAARGQ